MISFDVDNLYTNVPVHVAIEIRLLRVAQNFWPQRLKDLVG